MGTDPLSDEKIIESWERNASPWTSAIRDAAIPSRVQCTDQAIIDAVLSRAPRSALDLGCGEGWLARALAAREVEVTGVDVVRELIEAAKRRSPGAFRVMSYKAFAEHGLGAAFDAVVCNFSLLGESSVEDVVRAAPQHLCHGGALVIQTLHPVSACGDAPYRDGWRKGSWDGFGTSFTDPAPWYFRTLESWVALIVESGLRLCELREPTLPGSDRPASVILIAETMHAK